MRRDDSKKRTAPKTSRKQAEQESLLWYFERMDQVNRAMQGTNDLEQAMKDVLDTLLTVFECDRAWLVYPCDPEAPTWQVPMERTTPEYPGMLPIGVELPLDPVGVEVFRKLRATEGPVKYGPGYDDPVPTPIAQVFQVQSFIAMAFYPKIGKPWSFGLHQCSYARVWTLEEERLFQEIGRRLSDTLSSLLAYRNLQENERQIKQLIDASPVAMVVSLGTGELVEWVNDKFIELFGYTAEDMPDVEHWWPLAYPDEDYRAEIKAQWDAGVQQAMREKGQIQPIEAVVRCKDGLLRHIEFRLSSIGEKHLVTFVDLTERKHVEEALRERERHSQSLLRFSRKLEQAQTYSDVLNAAQDEVREIIGYQNLWAYLFTPDKKYAKALFAKGPMSDRVLSEDGTGTIAIQGDRMMEEFLETTEIMVVEDAQVDERTDKKIAAKMGNRTLVHVPILLFDRLLGSIGMGTFGDEGVRVPTVSEREYLIALASHMSVTLDRLHLLDRRKQIEQELVTREREYRVLVENIPDLIVRYDSSLRRIYVNPAWERASGLSAEDVLNVPYTDIPSVPNPVNNEYLEKLQQVLTSGTTQAVEFSWVNAKGVTLFLEYVIVPEYDRDGNISGVLSVGHDLTAHKKAESQLLASEQLFRALVENSPDFIARYDRECRRIYVNPAIQKLFGIPREQVLGNTPADQSPVYTPQVFMDHLKRVIETGTESVTEMPYRTTQGEMHWSHMRFVPEFGPDGQVGSVLHIGRDIHEIKENERRFRMLAENFPDFVIRFDNDGRYLYVNPAFEKAFGIQAESVLGKTLHELPKRLEMQQDDLPLTLIRSAFDEGIANESEMRWDTETGERIFENRYVPEKDATGNVVTVLCIARDVTEQKRAAEELQKTNDLLRAIIEAAPTAIIGLDLEGKVQIVWNPAAEKMLGWSAEEAMGKFLPSVPVDKGEEFQRFRQWVRSGKSLDGVEVQRKKRDGSLVDYSIYASPLRDAGGNITGNVAVLVDIGERKQMTEALVAREREFRTLAENSPDNIARYDVNCRTLYVNPALEKTLARPASEMLGTTPIEAAVIAEAEKYQKKIAEVLETGKDDEMDLVLPDRGEGVHYHNIRFVAERGADGAVTGVQTIGRDITERKRADEALWKSSQMLKLVLDNMPAYVFWKDRNCVYLGCNVLFAANAGLDSPEEIIGLTDLELPWKDTEAESYRADDKIVMETGMPKLNYEETQLTADGRVTVVRTSKIPLKDPDGTIIGVLGTFEDITERKQAEEQRRNHLRFLESMDKVNRAMQSANDLEWIMNDVLDIVLSIFNCDRAYLVYPCDPDAPSWSARAESTRPEYPGVLALGIDAIPVDADVAEMFRILLSTDGPATFGAGNQYPLPKDSLERFGLRSLLSMAFYPKIGKPWHFGIHQCSYARVWTPEDQRLFHEIGRRLSDVLTVLLAYRHLQESEERYRQLVNVSPDAIAVYSQGQIVFANPVTVKMVGAKSQKELIGRSVVDFIHPDFRETVTEQMEHMLKTSASIPFVEEKFLRLDGSMVDVEVAVVSYQEQGMDYLQIVARDITERKRHEREREAIIAVSTALRRATTRTDILNIILDQLIDLFKADGAILVLPDPRTGGFVNEMGRGPVGERMVGLSIPPGIGVGNWVLQNKKPYLNNRADQDPLFYRPDLLGDSYRIAFVPLIAQEQAIGTLWITRQTDILEQELRLLNAIADIAANAIHRVMLHEQTEQQLHHLIALHQIDLAISANFDLNVTLNVILKNVKDELEVDAASVLLLNAVTYTLDYAAGIGFRTRRIEQSHVKLGSGCAGRAAQEYRTISYPILDEAPGIFSRSSLLFDEAFLSHYATPLIVKGQVKGVLEIFHRQPLDSEPEWIDYFETLATQAAIAIESASLFENLQRTNLELMLAYDATIEGWSRALDLRDRETEGHTQRVTEMVLELAEKIGMSDLEKVDLRRGALLHDIGKMGVPDSILLKPGPLTESEREIMRQHPSYAFQMLSPIPYLKYALAIPYCHHERWDGSGYPRGLKGEQIPLSARLFAVVDVFDALTSDRPYRSSWPLEEVYRYIQEQAGRHFDPRVVQIFLEEK